MRKISRRRFAALGALSAAAAAGGGVLSGVGAPSPAPPHAAAAGKKVSPITGKELQAVPSVCWQCVTQDPITGYLEDGRLVKIEGNPGAASSGGKICAKGHAGINQVYNPDRLLYPIKRAGRRGEGRWERITWKEALDLIVEGGDVAGRKVKGLRALREAGSPEKFLFHYGRAVGSDWTILMDYFLPAYGTGTVGDHNSICMSAYGTAVGLTGNRPGMWDFGRAQLVLNFGANILEATTNHIANARRFLAGLERGMKVYTFDVRLSNTATMSTEWIPVKPGTDLAVILAMCRALLDEGLYNDDFLREYTNVTSEELKTHLAPYTPEWAERISGVPASKIRSIAHEFGTIKPSTAISFRGAYMHHNGVETQRAILMLDAIANHEITSGSMVPGPAWQPPFPQPGGEAKSLPILSGEPGAYAVPDTVSHQILHMIDKGPHRPDIYMIYCHNPVFSNGDCARNAEIFKDESRIPFLIASDVILSESSGLADLVLPDATYLERWALAGKGVPGQGPEYAIRQPMHAPLGEARNFCDVACDLSARLGLDLGFRSAEEFVRKTCGNTPGVREAGGFEYMRKHGVWTDPAAQAPTVPRSKMTLKSETLAGKGFSAIPAWMPIPGHDHLGENELVLTTFKSAVHTQSRSQNCKWLSELYHDNPAWIHTETAARLGIRNGDDIRIASTAGEIVVRAFVTEGIHPQALALSFHGGHWAHGVYASGTRGDGHREESDEGLMWWKRHGSNPNRVIPIRGDPIGGAMCWNDTVVRVARLS